jgi:hypothetical protein
MYTACGHNMQEQSKYQEVLGKLLPRGLMLYTAWPEG